MFTGGLCYRVDCRLAPVVVATRGHQAGSRGASAEKAELRRSPCAGTGGGQALRRGLEAMFILDTGTVAVQCEARQHPAALLDAGSQHRAASPRSAPLGTGRHTHFLLGGCWGGTDTRSDIRCETTDSVSNIGQLSPGWCGLVSWSPIRGHLHQTSLIYT